MKHWTQFALCLLLSSSIWLIHNLSQHYAGVVSVSVSARSTLRGREAMSREAVTVSARCSATGFKLLQLRRTGRDASVDIHAEDLIYEGGDRYVVSSSEMAKYASDIFGEGVTLLTFLNQNYGFEFAPENSRTVPVKAVISASYKSQYMAAGPVVLHPDSVTLYGPGAKLAAVDAVYTKPVNLGEVGKSLSGSARLLPVAGLRMSDSEVAWSLEVVRYVELRSQVEIHARNVPEGVAFTLYPSTAEAVFRCQFPSGSNPAGECEFYVDYNEFVQSLSGRCVARCDGIPAYVLDCRTEPEVFDCLVKEDAQ